MGVSGFKSILGEFPQAFDHVKPLCEKTPGILFPLLKDGALFTGTPSDQPENLYDPIIEAFDIAIDIAIANMAAMQDSDRQRSYTKC